MIILAMLIQKSYTNLTPNYREQNTKLNMQIPQYSNDLIIEQKDEEIIPKYLQK